MININQKKNRFLQDQLPVRLAGLAADLARIASLARHTSKNEIIADMLEESQYYIEWTAADTEPEIGGELVEMQIMIVLWRKAWPEAKHNHSQRTLLSVQAKQWSDRVLGFSGLREPA